MLEQYTRINQAAGVSLQLEQDGSYQLNVCSLSAQGSKLDFEQKLTHVATLEDLKKKLPAKLPVALNLSGKGILIKQIEKQDTITAMNFSTVLPNASYEDFYVQNFVSGDKSFVALIRKVEADKWIAKINALGFTCLSLSLSVFPVGHVLNQLNEYGEELIINGFQIQLDEQRHWLSYRYNQDLSAPFAIKLGGEKLDEQLVLPYAAAFQLILAQRLNPIEASVPALDTALEQVLGFKKIKAIGAIALGVFFALLLINFMLFSYYNTDNTKLAGQVSRTVQSTTDMQSLTNEIKQKESLLQQLGWENSKGKAWMMDQVAQCLPPEVTWQQAAVNPSKMVIGQKTIAFEDRIIHITGSSPQIIAVNEWLARLKSKSWIKQAQLESYNYNNEQNTGQFSLILHY